jgi:hypothetical protein
MELSTHVPAMNPHPYKNSRHIQKYVCMVKVTLFATDLIVLFLEFLLEIFYTDKD